MSYSIIAAILLATIALSSSNPMLNNERNVLARFYPNFAQLYRPATLKSYVDEKEAIERYQFFFTVQEYSQISEKSLTMLHTNVIERTITYHPMPNFEVNGSRYFYRRDLKQIEPVEIELVNSEDLLFRDVQQPNRYFYLSSFNNLEYSNQVPIMPYYEVTFICNSSFSTDTETQPPLLSYIDRSFQYTSRYLLDVPCGTSKQCEMYAYADIRNNGGQSFVIKGAELINRDVSLDPKSFDYMRTGMSNVGVLLSAYATDPSLAHLLGEQGSGTHIYQLTIPSSIKLPPRSIKSVQFFGANVTVEQFVYYSSSFSSVNSSGKLLNAYNLTSVKNFIPHGRLLLHEQERFVGQIDLPDLSIGQTFTMTFGYDAGVSYRRQVKILEGDEYTDSITYYVEYLFKNSKLTRDVRVYFTESLFPYQYFQIQNISTSNDKINFPDLISSGTNLRGYMLIPPQGGEKMISYNVIIYKFKPTSNV